MRKLWVPVIAVALLVGCNTMIKKTYQKITVHTPGAENVECKVETTKNKWRLIAPGEVLVDRSRLPLRFTCEKANYETAVLSVESHIDMTASQLNLFNGVVPGTSYDVASNSVYDYPETIVLEMKPSTNPGRLEPRIINVLQEKERASSSSASSKKSSAMDDEKIEKIFSKNLKK